MKIGDRVEIVEYGHVENWNDECGVTTVDKMPHLIGKKGTIQLIKGRHYYISDIDGKYGPYYRDQLKKCLPTEIEKFLEFLNQEAAQAEGNKLNYIGVIKLKLIEVCQI